MTAKEIYIISGKKDGKRIDSRILEELIQQSVACGHRNIEVEAFGQHGIGGRLFKSGDRKINITISGYSGQRVGAMGFADTNIEVAGPASDDVGWLNAGAHIVVHGNAGNGVANGMAQGKIYVAGNIGSRGMTMTKHNPRFEPPELWVLGSAGDYFGEFMAGGTAVICGIDSQTPENVLGYRPFVGMVGGKAFFRGSHGGFSNSDARLAPISDDEWSRLLKNMRLFLKGIRRPDLLETLSVREMWQLIVARSPQERSLFPKRPMRSFKSEIWDKELGKGGLIGDLTLADRSLIPVITTGALRRFVPVWENRKYLAPCEAGCPTGIPVQERWSLIRAGLVDEAVDLALSYTPFPATVCGYLCPNLCMQSCSRQSALMAPVDVKKLGQASIDAKLPELPMESGKKIAVLGGGPAGISVAWQLRMNGHRATVYDTAKTLGGKISSVIPSSRIPEDVVAKELERIRSVIPHVNLQQQLTKKDVEQLLADYDIIVVAVGARQPRMLPVPGKEKAVSALDFLAKAKEKKAKTGNRVVIIGAGNVGCDAATEAHRLGAREITMIDVQEPASYGAERKAAEAIGARFIWPCFTKEITGKGVKLESGEVLPADTVIISIGDIPDLNFLPESVKTDRGFVVVNEHFQTSEPKIFAIGDAVKPGLITDAIGAGRTAAGAISKILTGRELSGGLKRVIDKKRIKLEYLDSRVTGFDGLDHCGSQCSSCGTCRDCGICAAICPQKAISRKAKNGDGFEMAVDEERCIGCGFCAGACPCGVWNLVENEPIE
jgi:NADPH-dependent glutamate synthase beta subunit-like oxidoreductase/glutamate synthase domain-containing protein 3/NAD-dependent dihydropyrimidine dehydrogenase PreA subunit